MGEPEKLFVKEKDGLLIIMNLEEKNGRFSSRIKSIFVSFSFTFSSGSFKKAVKRYFISH